MDTKILMVTCGVVMSLVALGFMFMSEQTLAVEKAGSVFDNPTGFVVNYLAGDRETVPFRAEIKLPTTQNIVFSLDDIDSFYVDFGPESKFTVSGLALRSATGGHIEFVDYSGSVEIKDKLKFAGSSKRVRTETNTFSKEKYVKVDGMDVVFTKILLKELNGQKMTFVNATGSLDITIDNNKANVPLDNKEVKIESFTGELQYYPDRVIIEGYGRVDTGFMKAPGN